MAYIYRYIYCNT